MFLSNGIRKKRGSVGTSDVLKWILIIGILAIMIYGIWRKVNFIKLIWQVFLW